jgi:SET domain-containing protein
MMMVKTRLLASPIEGLGLFAAEDIRAGAVVWRFEPGLDLLLTPDRVAALPSPMREFASRYGYLHTRTGNWILCCDDARFMNHADDPNTGGRYEPGAPEGYDVALRDIRVGEELTCDYRGFDAEFDVKMGLSAPKAS